MAKLTRATATSSLGDRASARVALQHLFQRCQRLRVDLFQRFVRPLRGYRQNRCRPRGSPQPRSHWRHSGRRARCRRPLRPRGPAAGTGNASTSGGSKSSVKAAPRSSRWAGVATGRGRSAPTRSARACRAGRGGRSARRRGSAPCRARSTGVHHHLDRVVGAARTGWWASISSRPLFISVAESIVIFAPMRPGRVLKRAVDGDTLELRARDPRNGPPDAVMTRPSTDPSAAPSRHWASAECSLSTGQQAAARTVAGRQHQAPRRPPGSPCWPGRRRRRASNAARVASRPAAPITPFKTMSAPHSRTSCGGRPGAVEHVAVKTRSGARSRVGVGQRDHRDVVRTGGGHELVGAGVRRQPAYPQLGCVAHDLERLHPDRARRSQNRNRSHADQCNQPQVGIRSAPEIGHRARQIALSLDLAGPQDVARDRIHHEPALAVPDRGIPRRVRRHRAPSRTTPSAPPRPAPGRARTAPRSPGPAGHGRRSATRAVRETPFAAGGSHPSDRQRHEIRGRAGKQQRVDAVEHAAVAAQHPAGVLHPHVTLEVGLEQVADRRRQT